MKNLFFLFIFATTVCTGAQKICVRDYLFGMLGGFNPCENSPTMQYAHSEKDPSQFLCAQAVDPSNCEKQKEQYTWLLSKAENPFCTMNYISADGTDMCKLFPGKYAYAVYGE